jgi:TonB family protein
VLCLAFLTNASLVVAGARLWPEHAEPLRERPDFRAMQLIAVDEPESETMPPEEQVQQVALPVPDVEETPVSAQFVDQYDRRTDRETVSRNDLFGAPTAGQSGSSASSPPASAVVSRTPTSRSAATQAALGASREQSSLRPMPERSTDALDPAMPSPQEEGASGETVIRSPDSQGGIPEPAPPINFGAFAPGFGNPGAAIAAPPTRRSDHLDLPEGERTELNSVRSLYWSFFNRMHQALEREWDPHSVFAIHDPSFQLYGQQDRYTILRVTLNSEGGLRQAFVERSSGLDFYDDEAIRTFRAAAPFPNVPEGLKDESGNATFTFGFNFTFRSGSSFVRRLDGF